jgi:hypothetical protein
MLAVVCWSLFATTFVLEAVIVVRADRAWLVSRLPDDAFYYLEIGQRLSRGEGFTFDGVHATNGFHPLWQLMVAGLATAFSGDVLIRAAMLSGLVLLAMALVLVYRALVPVIGPTWSALAVTVAARPQGTLMNGVNAMEGALVAFTLALMVVALRRAVMLPFATRSAVLGVAAGLVVLSRLDFGVVILPVVLVVAVRAGVRQAGVAAAAWCRVALPRSGNHPGPSPTTALPMTCGSASTTSLRVVRRESEPASPDRRVTAAEHFRTDGRPAKPPGHRA